MSEIPFHAQKTKKMIQQDPFLHHTYGCLLETMDEPALQVVFSTYILGDSVMERKYLKC